MLPSKGDPVSEKYCLAASDEPEYVLAWGRLIRLSVLENLIAFFMPAYEISLSATIPRTIQGYLFQKEGHISCV